MLTLLAAAVLQIPADDYGALWEKCSKAIGSRYYARVQEKDKMDALLAKWSIPAKASKTRAEFNEAMDKMIRDFGASHFDFLTDEDQGYYAMDAFRGDAAAGLPNVGAWFRPGPDGYTVQMLLEGMPAQKAGLRKGDIVIKIDGEPFTPVASLRPRIGKSAKVTFRREGKELQADVEVVKQQAFDMFLDATKNSARIIEEHGKKIAYVHLWTMANEASKNALSNLVYGKFRDTDAFILDIRDGFGGRPEGYGDPFFRPDVNLEWKSSPTAGMKQLFGYGRPLVVLTNEGSRSAKEVFSAIMKKSRRATLIGSTTGGFVLGTSPYRVADWAYLEIPMIDVVIDGERLEGKGVVPDIKLPKEMDADGHDLHLAAALKFLDGKLR